MIGHLIIITLVFVLGLTLGASAIEYDRVERERKSNDNSDKDRNK